MFIDFFFGQNPVQEKKNENYFDVVKEQSEDHQFWNKTTKTPDLLEDKQNCWFAKEIQKLLK